MRGHFGLYSYHFLARELIANADEQVYTITPLRNEGGLTGEWALGEYFGLGFHLNYYRRQGKRAGFPGHRYRFIFVPLSNRIIEYDFHRGLLDIYARWYQQERRKSIRSFLQLNLGTDVFYTGQSAYPYHLDSQFHEPRKHDFYMGTNFYVSFGGGLQYRLADRWGMDTAFMMTWPGSGIGHKPFYFMQYGLQLGVYRMIRPKR
ncbi:MAG: hypothetical protein AAF927_22175 [Bacteroidota bacterium]